MTGFPPSSSSPASPPPPDLASSFSRNSSSNSRTVFLLTSLVLSASPWTGPLVYPVVRFVAWKPVGDLTLDSRGASCFLASVEAAERRAACDSTSVLSGTFIVTFRPLPSVTLCMMILDTLLHRKGGQKYSKLQYDYDVILGLRLFQAEKSPLLEMEDTA